MRSMFPPSANGKSPTLHASPLRSMQEGCRTVPSPVAVVYLVDDDHAVREGLSESLTAAGFPVQAFASADEYLARASASENSCLLLDLRLPGLSGLDLQRQLAGTGGPPIIFISGDADVPSSVNAIKAGAVEFLTKPVDPDLLLAAIEVALARDKVIRKKKVEQKLLRDRLFRLTPREQEVLPLIVGGLLNKQAASLLGISEVTLQIHRSQVMRKMEAQSVADLVRMALKLRIPDWRQSHFCLPCAQRTQRNMMPKEALC